MICFLESYLDPSVSFDNENLNINRYTFGRPDQPGNVKRAGVCVLRNPYLLDVCLTPT